MVQSVQGRRVLSIFLSGLIVCSGGVPSAWAAPSSSSLPVLVMPPWRSDTVSNPAALRLREQLETAVDRRDGWMAVGLPRAITPPATQGELSNAADAAHALLDKGGRLFTERRFDAAASTLQKGIEAALASPAQVDFSRVLESLVSLASAQLRLGNDERAQTTLTSLARFAPDYKLETAKFPPVFVREFERAKKKVDRSTRVELAVSGPKDAKVTVDGRSVGLAPWSEKLPSGTHAVVVESAGQRWGQSVELRSPTSLVGVFASPGVETVGPELGLAEQDALADVAKGTKSRAVLVFALTGRGEAYLKGGAAVYLPERNGFRRLTSFETNASGLLSEAVLKTLLDGVADSLQSTTVPLTPMPIDLLEPPPTVLRAMPTDTPKRSVTTPSASATGRVASSTPLQPQGPVTRDDGEISEGGGIPWWVWTLGAVGVAAAAGATVYGVKQANEPVTGTVNARW